MAADPIDLLPRYAQVKQQLWKDIQSGRYGERLPSEPDLAKVYGISRMTLRRAIGELAHEGFLSSRRGLGTFVCGHGSPPIRTRSIGFVLDARINERTDDPYYSMVFQSLVTECAKDGYTVTVGRTVWDLVPESPAEGRAARRFADGIIAAGFDSRSIKPLARMRLPLVLIDSVPLRGRWSVMPDHLGGATAAVEFLLDLGHRRIGHISGPVTINAGRERMEAWQTSMEKRGVKPRPDWLVEGNFSYQDGYQGMARLLAAKEPPTAVFCANDRMALGALRWLHERGIRVPDEVSVVGFDDIEVCEHSHPRLTTINIPRGELAAVAARHLLELLDGEAGIVHPHHHPDKPALTRIPTRLVVRESAAPPKKA